MIQQQSIKAYDYVKKDLSKRQAQVLNAIFHLNRMGVPTSDKQISKYLKLPINSVVPRRNELEKKNRIYCEKIGIDGIGNQKVALWKIRGAYP